MALQKQYRGLSNLVGLYEGGNLLLELGRAVMPTVDVLQFAAPPQWERKQVNLVGGVGTNYAFDQVPTGERRILWRMGIASSAILPAGRILQLTPALVIDSGSWQMGLESNPFQYTWTGSQDHIRIGKEFPGGLVLNAGDQLAWFVNQNAGTTAIAVQMTYQYSKVVL